MTRLCFFYSDYIIYSNYNHYRHYLSLLSQQLLELFESYLLLLEGDGIADEVHNLAGDGTITELAALLSSAYCFTYSSGMSVRPY